VSCDGLVGTATCYGLDGPWIGYRWRRDFLLTSRLAMGPTQHPIHWVLGLFCRSKELANPI